MLTAGPFELDVNAARLTRRGVVVPLSGQPMAILALLMTAPGRLVSRAELKDALWPNSQRIDTERRLNTAMRALREALGDVAETPNYIQTVRGRGYRWIYPERSRATHHRGLIASTTAALFCAIAACSIFLPQRFSDPLTAVQQTQYLRAAAASSPQAGAAELAPLLLARPDYAPARLLNASLHVQQWRSAPSPQTLSEARRALNSAQAVDTASSDVAALGAEIALKGDLDWRRAELRYRAALDREPGNFDARRGLAWLLLNAGRTEEAIAQVETLLGGVTLNDAMRADLGWLLLRARRPDLALSLCGVRSSLPNLLACQHTAYARVGESESAREAALGFMSSLGASADDLASVRRGDALLAYHRFLRWRAAQYANDRTHWFERAQAEAEAGQTGEALAHLEIAFVAGDPSRFKLATTPEFDGLRDSARFQRLLRIVAPI